MATLHRLFMAGLRQLDYTSPSTPRQAKMFLRWSLQCKQEGFPASLPGLASLGEMVLGVPVTTFAEVKVCSSWAALTSGWGLFLNIRGRNTLSAESGCTFFLLNLKQACITKQSKTFKVLSAGLKRCSGMLAPKVKLHSNLYHRKLV